MTDVPTFFTVAQITRGLGVDYKVARRLMARATGKPEARRLRGQEVDHYPISTFPPDVEASLRRIAQKRGYASISRLLDDPPQRWQPKHPLERLADSGLDKAKVRHAVLAPTLSASDALQVHLSELIRRAQAEFRQMIDVKLPQDLAVRGWIERAVARDGGWQEWNRIELYLDDDPPLRAEKEKPLHAHDDVAGIALARALSAALLPDTPTEEGICAIWHAAFSRFSELVDGGTESGTARRLLMEVLAGSGLPLLPVGASARSHAWARSFKKWQDGGECAEAMRDRRAFNTKENIFEFTSEELSNLRYWRLLKGSLDLAVTFFYRGSYCLPANRVKIEEYWDDAGRRRRPANWPISMRRAAEVTAEEEAKLRGEKAFKELQQVSHRGMWYPGPDGEKIPLAPNTVWESDDMSINEPYCFLDPENGEEIMAGRQTLTTQDVYSGTCLSVMPVGRIRDAYRVEDCADLQFETVLAHGLPDVWRQEGGVWDNNLVNGILLPDGTRWGGLRALYHVERARGSRGKGGIEVSYNFLQSMLAHESPTIGRKRGEFERETKLMLRAKAGDERAAAKLWTISQAADGFAAAMRDFNATPKTRRAFGRDRVVPNDLYRGAVRKECPENELWRFCPIKKLMTIRRACVEVSAPNYPRPFCFRVNGESEVFYLEHGYRVLIAFHPGHPERGCHVFNAEVGARNRENRKFAEFMLVAPFVEEQAQFGQSFTGNDSELVARNRTSAAVAHEFRAIMATGTPRISERRDGQGGSRRVELGGAGRRPATDDSIKAQRAAKRKQQADNYARKAFVSESELAAMIAENKRRHKEMEERGDFLGYE